MSNCLNRGIWTLSDVRCGLLDNEWNYLDIGTFGTLWAWGFNSCGAIGDNTAIWKSSPVQIPGTAWNDITAGIFHSLARKTDGTLWSWGGNPDGRLGNNTTVNRSSPIQVPGTAWNDIAAGGYHSLARKTDGSLWSWGGNSYGILGDNTTINKSSPIQIPGTAWNDISNGCLHSLARKTDGTLWSWGLNSAGYNVFNLIGDNTTIPRSSPVQIPGTAWNDIAAGSYHSLARKTDGTLWGWGTGISIGANTTIPRSSPVQVPGTAWNDITVGQRGFSLARKTDGTLWSWGNGNYFGSCSCGWLGDGTSVPKSSPVQIPGTAWNDISSGGAFSLARKTDGTLWAWGDNSNYFRVVGKAAIGQLGDNTTIPKSSPIQIPGAVWIDVDAGHVHSLAIKS